MTLAYLRLLFALQVVDIHSRVFQKFFNSYASYLKLPFLWLGDGHLAVMGFFVMSGYLVGLISQKDKSLLHFSFTRYLRIYPLYWFVLIFYFLVFLHYHMFGKYMLPFPSVFVVLLNITLLPAVINFFDINQTRVFWQLYLVPTWTLTFDVLLYPFGFILMRYLRLAIPVIISMLGLLYVFATFHQPHVFIQTSQHSFFFDYMYSLPAFMFLPFFVGILLFKFKEHIPLKKPLFVGAFLVYLYLCYFPAFLPSLFVGYVLGLLSLSYIIVYVAKNGKSKYESLIANYTYSLYLVHYPIIVYFFRSDRIVGVLVSVVVALIFLIPETFFENLRHKLKPSDKETNKKILIGLGIFFVLLFVLSNLFFSALMPVFVKSYVKRYIER